MKDFEEFEELLASGGAHEVMLKARMPLLELGEDASKEDAFEAAVSSLQVLVTEQLRLYHEWANR